MYVELLLSGNGRILFIIRIRYMVDEVDENQGPLVGKVELFERNTVQSLGKISFLSF